VRHCHMTTRISHRFSGYLVVLDVAEHIARTTKKEIGIKLSYSR
jgi:hypothetical protein